MSAQCNFPWLLSNVFDIENHEPLADGSRYIIIEKQGLKIGVVGLVERDWLDTIAHMPPVHYHDYIKVGKELCHLLKNEHTYLSIFYVYNNKELRVKRFTLEYL